MDKDSSATEIPTKKRTFVEKLPYILIGIGLLFPFLGKIVFLGPFLVFFAPNFLLVGISLVIVKLLISPDEPGARIAVFLLVCIVLGLNTRIPSIAYDVLFSRDEANIVSKLPLSVGDSIHLDSNVTELSARNFSYTGSRPHCNEGFCAIITRFSPPSTRLGIDYWREDPAQSIKSFGFSLAKLDQKAPTLKIRTSEEGHLLNVNLELLDDTGKQLSSESRIYRNGFPLESQDSDGKGRNDQQFVWAVEYMLHGNMVSSFVGRKFGYSLAAPAGHFLNSTIERYVQQDDPNFTQLLEPKIEKVVEINSGMRDEVWNSIFFDLERTCKTFVQPETDTVNVHDFTVEGGIRGMGKARSPFKFLRGTNGNERLLVRMGDRTLCDGDYLYLIARTNPRPYYSQYEISKYRYDGAFIYRVAFEMPKSPTGFMGSVSPTSLKEVDGVLRFDYVDFENSGRKRSINRIRSMWLLPAQQAVNAINSNAKTEPVITKEIPETNELKLKNFGGGNCGKGTPKVSAEIYLQRGKILVALNKYKAAMICLMRAQEEEKDTNVYRDACSQIATMYELGWGVDKNIDTSKGWLRKAGL
ncbi:MAG: hypothetical protein ACMG55_09560 [Microcoleus sp.]